MTFPLLSSSELPWPLLVLLVICGAILWVAFILLFLRNRRLESMRKLEQERAALMDLTLHQLGEPLATFKWWLELLNDPESDAMTTKNEIQSELAVGVARMESIMRSLRDANNVRKTQVQYLPERVSLQSVVTSVCETAKERLRVRGQRLVIEGNDCGQPLRIDRKLIAGVLLELIDNASNYSPLQSVITIRTDCSVGHMAKVEVHDEGVGIPASELSHITEKNVRGSNAEKAKPIGNGLGLYIAKGIIERAGGRLWVESRENQGTSAFVTVPIC